MSPAVMSELDKQASSLKFKGKEMSRNQLAKLILEKEVKQKIVSTELEEVTHLSQSVSELTDILGQVLESNNELVTLLLNERMK